MSADAERAVLASILYRPDTIMTVRDSVSADVFASQTNRTIYAAMLATADAGDAPDLVNVSAILERDGHDAAASLLADLYAEPVTAFYLPSYIETLLTEARRRAVIAGATKVIEAVRHDPTVDVAGLLQRIAVDLPAYGQSSGPRALADIVPELRERFAQQRAGTWTERVTTTGFPTLDKALAGGFRPGELIVLAGRPGMGKALALDTPLPTPDGWTTMGDVRVGMRVFDEQGDPCRVTFATEVMLNRPCYRVRFSDGSEIVADAEHRWLTSTDRARKGREPSRVVTTAEIAATLHVNGDQRRNHSIEATKPLALPLENLPVPPYTLGAWLGDGDSDGAVITTADPGVLAAIRVERVNVGPGKECNSGKALAYRIGGGPKGGDQRNNRSLHRTLREIGLLKNKHIPLSYLRAARAQRTRLLAGLMDTDGYIDPVTGVCEFVSNNERLARDVAELIATLGWIPSVTEKAASINGRPCGSAWRVRFSPDDYVFWLERKRKNQKLERRDTTRRRYIVAVDPIPSVPVRCITVDSPSHLYLAGRGMIPTHNTAMGLALALHAAQQAGPALIFSLEMPGVSIVERAIADAAGLPMETIRAKQITEQQHRLITTVLDRIERWPVHIDDRSGLTTEQVAARAQRFAAEHRCALIVADYLEIMGDTNAKSEERRVGEISLRMKNLARSLNLPVVLLAQVSREVERDRPPVPKLSHLRYSGSIEANADIVLMLYRNDYYVEQDRADEDESKADTCDVLIRKQRNGSPGTVTMGFRADTMTFSDPTAMHDPWRMTA